MKRRSCLLSIVFAAWAGAVSAVWAQPGRTVTIAPTVLTADALTQLMTFWTAFANDADSVRGSSVTIDTVYSGSRIDRTELVQNIPAMAVMYPSVKAALTRAGLTSRRYASLFATLLTTCRTFNGNLEGNPVTTTPWEAKNIAFLKTHQRAFRTLVTLPKDKIIGVGDCRRMAQSLLTQVPDLPHKPDLVTAIPFAWKPDETYVEQTKVVIRAEVDGHRGNFVVDLGDPFLWLNRTFLQPSPTGGVDTVTDANRIPDHTDENSAPSEWDKAHVTMHIGTLRVTFDDPAQHGPYNAALNHEFGNFAIFGPRLGNIGLCVLEQFETIIDYTHRRLILIRLDKAGHRMVKVPAYTPTWSAPLIDIPQPYVFGDHGEPYSSSHYWGVQILLGGMPDSVFFDTGAQANAISSAIVARAQQKGRTLNSLVIADRTFQPFEFSVIDGGDRLAILGYPFLSHLGAVGFNHRTHQFLLYR